MYSAGRQDLDRRKTGWRAWTPFVGVQVPYNLLKRDIERERLSVALLYIMNIISHSIGGK